MKTPLKSDERDPNDILKGWAVTHVCVCVVGNEYNLPARFVEKSGVNSIGIVKKIKWIVKVNCLSKKKPISNELFSIQFISG